MVRCVRSKTLPIGVLSSGFEAGPVERTTVLNCSTLFDGAAKLADCPSRTLT